MILRASGTNATIDLFEHHLVINRRQSGVLFDGPDAEHMIPLASIASVQFVRPSFMASGKIVLVLAAGSSTRSGTTGDPNTVFFTKAQLAPFENVLRAIQAAIATPSIERLAMEAQRRQSIGSGAPRPVDGKAIEVVPQPNAQGGSHQGPYSGKGTYEYETNGEDTSRPPPTGAGGWWRDMPTLGKVILIGGAAILLLNMCSSGTSTPGNDADVTTTETGSPEETGPASTEAMLRDLNEFISGKASATDIAVTDGPGDVGEFCSASTGSAILSFGGTEMDGKSTGVFNYFYAYKVADGGTSTSGEFQFDRTAGQVTVRSVRGSKSGSKEQASLPDLTISISQVSPGTVVIDGVTYHSCVI